MLPDADQVAPAEYPPGYPFAPQSRSDRAAAGEFPAQAELPVGYANTNAIAIAVVALVGCGMLNLLMIPVVEGLDGPAPLVGLVYAFLLAQLAGHSLWTVFSERPLWLRVLWGTVVLEVLLLCAIIGASFTAPSDFGDVARVMFCSLPLVTLCAQAPLWALRIYAQWRMTAADGSPEPPPRPLSIRDILWATGVVAVAISLVRVASDSPDFHEVAWLGWAVAAPSIAAASLLSLPLALFLVLRGERPVAGLFLLWGYATFALAILIVGVALFGGRIRGEELMGLAFTLYGFASLLWSLLYLIRACNYRLAISP